MSGLLSAYERTTATRKASNGQDQYGVPAARTETTIKGRLVQKEKFMRDGQGNEVVATHYFLTGYELEAADKLSIGGVEYQIVTLEEAKDFTRRGRKAWLR